MKAPFKHAGRHGRTRALTIKRLNQLTAADLNEFTSFAERRLGWVPRSSIAAEDVVQKALHSILRGTRKGKSGRRPTIGEVRTKQAFLFYIRSAINSVVEATQRKPEFLFIHESIHLTRDAEEKGTRIVLTALCEPDGDACMVDLKTELFLRLRKQAPSRLMPTIDEWEKTFFWASHVPSPQEKDHARQVRVLAMRVLKGIAEDLSRYRT
jgi:hypothetical protein